MVTGLKDRLVNLGFTHKEFPDGWFWFVQPTEEGEIIQLASALGYEITCPEEIPDTVIFQVNEDEYDFQYVCDADFDTIPTKEGLEIIESLEEIGFYCASTREE